MATIDSDAHVIETENTWGFMSRAEERFRPVSVAVDGLDGEYWQIGDRLFPRRIFAADKARASVESQEMQNIEDRLRHMDELGVDVHVLYPTLFLQPVTTSAAVEAALYRTYNRWIADIWSRGRERLLWAALVPTMTMDLALAELRWAKEHGSCAVFLRASEGGRMLSDPYFSPLYTEASRLDMPICIHSGNGTFSIQDLYEAPTAIMARAKLSALGAIHEIILSGLPQRFPDLRFGVIETSASWIPYLCHDLAARFARTRGRVIDRDEILRVNQIYVACQTDDDLPYILHYAGEDRLVIGSDYGHADTSSELEALRKLKDSSDLPSRVIDRILDDNARELYGLGVR